MTKKYRNWLIAAAVAVAAALALFLIYSGNKSSGGGHTAGPTGEQKQELVKNYQKEEAAIMSKMMEDMHNVSPSGNASVHFLYGMIPHHESAIAMAESYLKYGGQNEELKQLAQDIIDTQTKEIEEMNSLIQEIESEGQKDEEKESNYLDEYNQMMASHHQDSHSGHNQPADVEKAFAEGMIVHHQMAVEMSEAILKYTDNENVKTLAENIISTQEKEIEQMRNV